MIKFVESHANKESGCTEVVLSNNGELYRGYAQLAEGDNWSEIFGCRIAEIRATIKVLNDVILKKRGELETIENFISTVKCYKNFDNSSKTAACLYRQLNRKKKEIEHLKEKRASLKKFITDSIEMREKIENRIAKK